MFNIASTITYCVHAITRCNSINMNYKETPNMIASIFALTLTVCWNDGTCAAQRIQLYDNINSCMTSKLQHENISADSKFCSSFEITCKSVVFKCVQA
jgi:hypothetical protein